MNPKHAPHASTRTTFGGGRAPRTLGGIALYVGFAALVPLTLFALANPAVVAAGAFGLAAGLLVAPLRRRLARRRRRATGAERSSEAFGPAATRE